MPDTVAVPLLADQWLKQFRDQLYHVPLGQLVRYTDTHRLIALALLITLQAHQWLSELGPAPQLRQALQALWQKLEPGSDAGEAAPPDLAEMTLVLEIAAAALSMLEARRIAAGVADTDVPTEVFGPGLLRLVEEACAAGGARAAASVMPLLHACAGAAAS